MKTNNLKEKPMKSKKLQKKMEKIKPVKAWGYINKDGLANFAMPCKDFEKFRTVTKNTNPLDMIRRRVKLIPVLITPLK